MRWQVIRKRIIPSIPSGIEVVGGFHKTQNYGTIMPSTWFSNAGIINEAYQLNTSAYLTVDNLLSGVSTSTVAWGKYIFTLSSTRLTRNNLDDSSSEYISGSGAAINGDSKIYVYNENTVYMITQFYNPQIVKFDFITDTFTIYTISEGFDTCNAPAAVLIGDYIILVYAKYRNHPRYIRFRIFDILAGTFSNYTDMWTAPTSSYITGGPAQTSFCIFGNTLVGWYEYIYVTPTPDESYDRSFAIDIFGNYATYDTEGHGSNVFSPLGILYPDFKNNRAIGTNIGVDPNEMIAIYSNGTYNSLGASSYSPIATSKTEVYCRENLGGLEIYTLEGSYLGDLPLAECLVSNVADDITKSLIIYNYKDNATHDSKIQRVTFLPDYSVDTLVDGMQTGTDTFTQLFGERIRVGPFLYYADTSY